MRLIRISAIALLLIGTSLADDRKLVTRVEPEYPELIARMQVHGTVKLKLYVNPDGTIQRVEYVSGNPLLGEPATKAAKKWKYEAGAAPSTLVVEIAH